MIAAGSQAEKNAESVYEAHASAYRRRVGGRYVAILVGVAVLFVPVTVHLRTLLPAEPSVYAKWWPYTFSAIAVYLAAFLWIRSQRQSVFSLRDWCPLNPDRMHGGSGQEFFGQLTLAGAIGTIGLPLAFLAAARFRLFGEGEYEPAGWSRMMDAMFAGLCLVAYWTVTIVAEKLTRRWVADPDPDALAVMKAAPEPSWVERPYWYQSTVLASIVGDDGPLATRKAALDKITDERVLNGIAAGTSDVDIGVAAVQKMNDADQLMKVAWTAVKGEVRVSAVGKLGKRRAREKLKLLTDATDAAVSQAAAACLGELSGGDVCPKAPEPSSGELEQVRAIFRRTLSAPQVMAELKQLGFSRWEQEPDMAIVSNDCGSHIALMLNASKEFYSAMHADKSGQQTCIVRSEGGGKGRYVEG